MNTIIYIDAQNIHKGIEQIGRIIDMAKFYIFLKDKYRTTEIKLFIGYIAQNQKFYDFLQRAGYQVIFKKTLMLVNGEIKGNVDIDIAVAMMNDYYQGHLGKLVLVSGDGDYNTLIEDMKQKGVQYYILAPTKQKCSRLLSEVSEGRIAYIEQMKQKIQRDQKSLPPKQ